MKLADTLQHVDFTPLLIAWGEATVGQALRHPALGLSADTDAGTTRNRRGNQSRFLNWTSTDASVYQGRPAAVFWDFFRGSIANSCSRIDRGLTP